VLLQRRCFVGITRAHSSYFYWGNINNPPREYLEENQAINKASILLGTIRDQPEKTFHLFQGINTW
ncbi:hypothetical protein, partial [Nonlabens antarcticus]|uniref:hypothetical protein n=1 Tax=Nonlabens antarcticus TaxID=392714 RepID=UPI001E5A2A75